MHPVHICIVTTAHAIDDPRVDGKMAEAFVRAGFRVTWVGPDMCTFGQASYRRKGVTYALCPQLRSRVDRLLSGGRLRRLASTVKDVDVYYAPDPDSSPIALRLARETQAKVIFDIHEVYHGALLDRWLMGFQVRSVREFVRRRIARTAAKCSLVIGVSDQVLACYVSDGVTSRVLRSCAPLWFAGPDQTYDVITASNREPFLLMHGKSAWGRGDDKVLDAAALLATEAPGLRVVMFSSGPVASDARAQEVLSAARFLGIADVVLMRDSVPMAEMPAVLRSCHAGMIAYGRSLGVDSLPNRLFEYMAAALPIVAPVYATQIAKIVEGEGCGVLADFEDPRSIADAVFSLYADRARARAMGLRGRAAFLARHNWNVESAPMLEMIRNWYPHRGHSDTPQGDVALGPEGLVLGAVAGSGESHAT